MVVPPKHPKMVIFSRKTHGCWGNSPFKETPGSGLPKKPVFFVGVKSSTFSGSQARVDYFCWVIYWHLPICVLELLGLKKEMTEMNFKTLGGCLGYIPKDPCMVYLPTFS